MDEKGQRLPVNIEDQMRESYMDYAMSVIIGRALPDARDGLKPVHRRILYAMFSEGLVHNHRYSKCAGVVGEVFSGLNVGVAGVLLVLSALARSLKLLFFLVLAVLVLLIGPVAGVPDLMKIDKRHVCLLAGLLLAEFGVVFNRAARQKT